MRVEDKTCVTIEVREVKVGESFKSMGGSLYIKTNKKPDAAHFICVNIRTGCVENFHYAATAIRVKTKVVIE